VQVGGEPDPLLVRGGQVALQQPDALVLGPAEPSAQRQPDRDLDELEEQQRDEHQGQDLAEQPVGEGVDGIERMRLVRDDIARRVDDLYERLTAKS